MRLYSVDLSPFSSKARMVVYAKGLDNIEVTPPEGFLTPAWREASPSAIGRLPILVLDDGHVIPESGVIAEYLEEDLSGADAAGGLATGKRGSACAGQRG